MASTTDLDEGMSAEEMWGLVKLVNRELKTTKSNLEAAQQENRRLQEEVVTLRNRRPSTLSDEDDSRDIKFTPCIRGRCNSADEVRTLIRLKTNLEVELESCRSALSEKTLMVERLRQENDEMVERNRQSIERINILQEAQADLERPCEQKQSQILENDITEGDESAMGPIPMMQDEEIEEQCFIPFELKDSLSLYPPPNVNNRPLSVPCLKFRADDPTSTIPQHVLQSCHASATLYCSGRMFWCSAPYQHAFFLAPGSLYHAAPPARWTRNTKLWRHIGQTREVFYCAPAAGKQLEVHYAGTYVCRHIGSLTNSEVGLLSKPLRTKLRGESLVKESASKKQIKTGRQVVAGRYPEGSSVVSFLFLQCIGFNEELYNSLKSHFHKQRLKRPRPALEPSGAKGPKKKKSKK